MDKRGLFSLKFLFLIIFVFGFASLFVYLVFFPENSESSETLEKILKSVGFNSPDKDSGSLAVPLPSRASSSSSGGSSYSQESSGETLAFCTFDAYHVISSEVPCRCGLTAVCEDVNDVCDATAYGGQGECSNE